MNSTPTHAEQIWQQVFKRLPLTESACQPLLAFTQLQHFSRNAPLVRAGERWESLYLVTNGILRMFYIDADGREFNKAFFAEGVAIWPVAPQDRIDAVKFHIGTVGKATVLALPIARVESFLREHKLWESFALPFAERLLEAKFSREHDLLMLSAAQRFEQFCQQHPHLIGRIPDYHLASMLGMTNVTLSRIRATQTSSSAKSLT